MATVSCTENFVKFGHVVLRARCHASAVYAVVVFVCLSVCLSACHKSVFYETQQRRRRDQGLWFSGAKDLGRTQIGSPPMEVPNAGGVG